MTYLPATDENIVRAADMSGDSADSSIWDERIENAIEAAYVSASTFGKVILPAGTITITKPIRLYRSTINSGGVDLTGSGVTNWNDVRELWDDYTNGSYSTHLCRRFAIEGESNGTQIVWDGNANGCMMDVPSPWLVEVRNLSFNGAHASGDKTVGIRVRAGWEFQTNTGRQMKIDRCYFTRLFCAIYLGDPFIPDLTNYTLDNIWTWGCLWGIYVQGSNVTGIEINNPCLQQFDYSGVYLCGSSATAIRTPTEITADSTLEATTEPGMRADTTRDLFGYEYSTQDCLNTKNSSGDSFLLDTSTLSAWDPQQAEEPGGGWTVAPTVAGGGPDVKCSTVIGSSDNPCAYAFKNYKGSLIVDDARFESECHVLYHLHSSWSVARQPSRYVNLSGSANYGVGGHCALINSGNEVYLDACYFNGPLYSYASVPIHDRGTRFGTGALGSRTGQCLPEQEGLLGNGWALTGSGSDTTRTAHGGNLVASALTYSGGTVTAGLVMDSSNIHRWRDYPYRYRWAVSTDFTVDEWDSHVMVTTGASDRTITLPAAATVNGQHYYIKKIDSGAGNVIIDGDGAETIDGAATKTLTSQWESAIVWSNGTAWFVIG